MNQKLFSLLPNWRFFLRTISIGFFLVLLLGIFDTLNLDNKFHSGIHFALGQDEPLYFDIQFVPTTLSIFEITGLFAAVYTSFFILNEQQKGAKETTRLSHQPFIKLSSSLKFRTLLSEPDLLLKNIGTGPGLFIRAAFVGAEPDRPENSILRSDQPHSSYLSPNEESQPLYFDLRKFYSFLTESERGGELGSNITNYNTRALRDELNNLIKNKVGQEYFIYIHTTDILGNRMIFKAKYLLTLEHEGQDVSGFLLKRMEIQQI